MPSPKGTWGSGEGYDMPKVPKPTKPKKKEEEKPVPKGWLDGWVKLPEYKKK